MDWMIRVLGFDSQWGLRIILFTASRMALGPTQPPIQLVLPGSLSLGVKCLRCEAAHSHPSGAEVKEWVELCLHSPSMPSRHGAQLKHRDNFTFTFYKKKLLQCLYKNYEWINKYSISFINLRL
jgi:hypothetical protein